MAQSHDQQPYAITRVIRPFKSSLPILKATSIDEVLLKEAKYRETFVRLLNESMVYEKMLKSMGDLTVGCKIGIRYADRTLYIDKPSIFQGAVRWFYGQTRDKIKDYIETEIMGSRGFVMLLYDVIRESNDIITLCASTASSTASSVVILSNDLRKSYRNICAVNVNLLLRVCHGLSVIRQTYEMDDARGSVYLDDYIATVQRKLKELRLHLEMNINKFAYYL